MLPPADTRHVSDFLYLVMHFSPYASPSTSANTRTDKKSVPITAGGMIRWLRRTRGRTLKEQGDRADPREWMSALINPEESETNVTADCVNALEDQTLRITAFGKREENRRAAY